MNIVAVRDLIPPEVEPFFSSGAKLRIHPEDLEGLKIWTRTVEIEVTIENMQSAYPFRLINYETGHSIRVTITD